MAPPKVDVASFTQMYTKGAEKLTGPFAKLVLTELGLDRVAEGEAVVMLDECCGYGDYWNTVIASFGALANLLLTTSTGIVQNELRNVLPNGTNTNIDLTCLDLANAMIDFTTKRVVDAGWKSARVVKGDVMGTGLPSSHFTHITLTFGHEIFADARGGYGEIYRMLKPGGRVGTAAWGISGYVGDVREALASLPSDVPSLPLDHTMRVLYGSQEFHWYDGVWLQHLVSSVGFVNVKIRSIPFTSKLPGSDYLGLILMLVGRIMQTHWTEGHRSQYAESVRLAVTQHFERKYGSTGIAVCMS
jgi:SAM-dependent methyltransferase